MKGPDRGCQEILQQVKEQNGNELGCGILKNEIQIGLAAGIYFEEPDDGEAGQGELPEQVAGFVAIGLGEPLGILETHEGLGFLSFVIQTLDVWK